MDNEGDSMPPAKSGRLGQRKRLALDQSQSEAKTASELASFLVEQWAWGHISPQMVQQVASKACADMKHAAPTPLQSLAKLGGGYANLMSAALIASQKSKLPDPFVIQLPYKKGNHMQKFLLPHEVFASIFDNYYETFQNVLVGPPGYLQDFWRTAKQHPCLSLHPAVADTSKQIPIGMHGDGVPITGKGKIWCRSAWVYSWASLLSQASTKDKQFFIGMVWDTLQGEKTMDTFLALVSWSIKYLQLGIWPMEDWQGKEFLGW